ncbi:MAG: hypothetical protein JST91_10150 [Actinobacteria bacterium]|nr:hypothetical protein [Actinomycetota bacterium]
MTFPNTTNGDNHDDAVRVVTPNVDDPSSWYEIDNPRTEFRNRDEISIAVEAAEAEAQRLRDKQEALAEAESEARYGTALAIYRDAAVKSVDYNHVRAEAETRLYEIANAGARLDVPALFEQFVRFKLADARCGANFDFVAMLDNIDPLPPTPSGMPQIRERRAQQIHERTSWSAYLDNVVNDRASTERRRHRDELHLAVADAQDQAARRIRSRVLALNDFDRLDVPTPPTITQLHQAAVDRIDEAQFDEDTILAAGIYNVRKLASKDALDKLVKDGN